MAFTAGAYFSDDPNNAIYQAAQVLFIDNRFLQVFIFRNDFSGF